MNWASFRYPHQPATRLVKELESRIQPTNQPTNGKEPLRLLVLLFTRKYFLFYFNLWIFYIIHILLSISLCLSILNVRLTMEWIFHLNIFLLLYHHYHHHYIFIFHITLCAPVVPTTNLNLSCRILIGSFVGCVVRRIIARKCTWIMRMRTRMCSCTQLDGC